MINATTVYSPSLIGQNFTSAGGQTLSVHINATGEYVTSGNVTALITQPDVLLTNGVLHVIDRVLLNTAFNENAATSAYVPSSLRELTRAQLTCCCCMCLCLCF